MKLKSIGWLLVMLTIALPLTISAFAQGDNTYYFTTYFSNANTKGAPDATVRIINDGSYTGSPYGNLWAAIYVFDDSQELQECCSCGVTPDGLLSESVNNNLTANPLTGVTLTRGVIKIVGTTGNSATELFPTPGLRIWATHIEAKSNEPEKGPFYISETTAAASNLSAGEQTQLQNLCAYDQMLSGLPCSCTPEGQNF